MIKIIEPKNLFKWNRIDLAKHDIPEWLKFAGTYVIFANWVPIPGKTRKKECIYIGQSNNIFARINRHLRMSSYTCHWWIRRKHEEKYLKNVELVVKKEKKEYERLMNEKRMIVRLGPVFNSQLKLFKKRKD